MFQVRLVLILNENESTTGKMLWPMKRSATNLEGE